MMDKINRKRSTHLSIAVSVWRTRDAGGGALGGATESLDGGDGYFFVSCQ